jgi:hypothetical protein
MVELPEIAALPVKVSVPEVRMGMLPGSVPGNTCATEASDKFSMITNAPHQ